MLGGEKNTINNNLAFPTSKPSCCGLIQTFLKVFNREMMINLREIITAALTKHNMSSTDRQTEWKTASLWHRWKSHSILLVATNVIPRVRLLQIIRGTKCAELPS